MPNIGIPELLIVLVILLVVFGPKRLPSLGRQLGSGMREFKDGIAGKSKSDDDHDEDDTDQDADAFGTPPAKALPAAGPAASATRSEPDLVTEDAPGREQS